MKFDIPLREMEMLEKKYGIQLHVEQYEDVDTPDSYWQILPQGTSVYLGHTIDEVERVLGEIYGKKNFDF